MRVATSGIGQGPSVRELSDRSESTNWTSGLDPLRQAPNLLLTPHAAWYSEAAIHQLQHLVAGDITRALAGQAPRKPVPQ